MTIRGVIFDFDGTVVDSGLDFEAIRREMSLPFGQPILEALAVMPDGSAKEACLEVLDRHEAEGARRATLMPGVREFLGELVQRGLKRGVLTRNSRAATVAVVDRLDLQFTTIVTREDAPAKPDPTGLFLICREWQIEPAESLFIGDFRFDIEAGRRAGMKTALYAPATIPEYASDADFVVRHFSEVMQLIDV